MGLMVDTKSQRGSQSVQLDPATLGIQGIRANQLKKLIQATGGGLSEIGRPRLDLAGPGPEELGFLRQLSGLPGRPLMQDLERSGLGRLATAANMGPESAVRAARGYFEDIAAPQITNSLIASGMGRSGAIGESLAKGGAELALPITESALNRQFEGLRNLGAAEIGMGSLLNQRELERLFTALEASGQPRMAAYQEFIERPQNLLQTLLTGLPVVTTPIGMRSRSTESEDIITKLLGSLLSGAGAGAASALV